MMSFLHSPLVISCTCLCICTEVIQQLQLQLLESERRNADYVQRFHKMQTDYCNLTETTAELVDALEATISGKTVCQVT